jgi:hypothetical protein
MHKLVAKVSNPTPTSAPPQRMDDGWMISDQYPDSCWVPVPKVNLGVGPNKDHIIPLVCHFAGPQIQNPRVWQI